MEVDLKVNLQIASSFSFVFYFMSLVDFPGNIKISFSLQHIHHTSDSLQNHNCALLLSHNFSA